MNQAAEFNVTNALNELLEAARQLTVRLAPSERSPFTSGVPGFDFVLPCLPPEQAYQLLVAACARYPLLRHNRALLPGFLHLIKDLVWQSNTTECPPGMLQLISDNPDEELRRWYRIDTST